MSAGMLVMGSGLSCLVLIIYFHQLIAHILNDGIKEANECHVDIAVHAFMSHGKDICELDHMKQVKLPALDQTVKMTLSSGMLGLINQATIEPLLPPTHKKYAGDVAKIITDCKDTLPVLMQVYEAMQVAATDAQQCTANFPKLNAAQEKKVVKCFADVLNTGLSNAEVQKMIDTERNSHQELKNFFIEFEFLKKFIAQVESHACAHDDVTHALFSTFASMI